MKIKKENQLGLNFTQEVRDGFYKLQCELYFAGHDEETLKPFRAQWLNVLSDEGNKNLLFSRTSREVADKIKIDKFQPSFFKVKKEKKLTFLIDGNHFYRIVLKDDEVFGLLVRGTPVNISGFPEIHWQYDTFKIIPAKNLVVFPKNQDDYINDEYFIEFLKLLIFTEYSELEEITVNPNQGYGTKKQGKYFNETKNPFIVVDSAWNKIIVR